MQVGQSARAVLWLGCSVVLVGALSGAWETLASQAPGSALYIAMLPGPIALLRETAITFGVLLVLAGLLLGERSLSWRWLWALYASVLLTLGSSLYAAVSGMHGVQANDLRADAIWLFVIKYLSRAVLSVCLVAIARSALTHAPEIG